MVVNATLAAMAKHAGKPGVSVYQVASSVANPIRVEDIFDIIFEHNIIHSLITKVNH